MNLYDLEYNRALATTVMTSETSELNEEKKLDVTVGTIKRLLIDAYARYNDGVKDGAHYVSSYWDGYIRALQHVLEQEAE